MHETMFTAEKWGVSDAPYSDQIVSPTIYDSLVDRARELPDRPAMTFQLFSGPSDPAKTLTWAELRARVAQAANAFRKLGINENTSVAFLLPNCMEVIITALAGATAGIVTAVNPILSPEHIAGILRESKATVVVTLAPFPKTEVAETVAAALQECPDVKHVLTVDLLQYLTGIKKLIVPFVRPKVRWPSHVNVADLNKLVDKEPKELSFKYSKDDRVCGYMHTGGTTGRPKIAQHTFGGAGYIGWLGRTFIAGSEDVWICPLPMFHVFGAHVILDSVIATGAHMVMVTPQGYRGEGVFDNFWALVERYRVSMMVMVPTAATQLMQRPIKNDVSSLRLAVCGSAPLPVALFHRFEEATGVSILEGYGMTESTGLISVNPLVGEKRIGSVGFPLPYTDVKIFQCDADGNVTKKCEAGEIGEICIASPSVSRDATYTEANDNKGIYADGTHYRTGDLGYLDKDGYLWITGRAKDLIIRGGHNIDPALIEDAMMAHPQVAFAGAIGQPDGYSGELPCVYLELVKGGVVSKDELMAFAKENIAEGAAVPKYIEIMDELPKTLVGKIFKPTLRGMAIKRVFDECIKSFDAEVTHVTEDKKRGLLAHVSKGAHCDEKAVAEALGQFSVKWEFEN